MARDATRNNGGPMSLLIRLHRESERESFIRRLTALAPATEKTAKKNKKKKEASDIPPHSKVKRRQESSSFSIRRHRLPFFFNQEATSWPNSSYLMGKMASAVTTTAKEKSNILYPHHREKETKDGGPSSLQR